MGSEDEGGEQRRVEAKLLRSLCFGEAGHHQAAEESAELQQVFQPLAAEHAQQVPSLAEAAGSRMPVQQKDERLPQLLQDGSAGRQVQIIGGTAESDDGQGQIEQGALAADGQQLRPQGAARPSDP